MKNNWKSEQILMILSSITQQNKLYSQNEYRATFELEPEAAANPNSLSNSRTTILIVTLEKKKHSQT